MDNESHSLINDNYFLKPGFIIIPTKATDISAVLGSCVAVCLYDQKRKTGAMNHFQLPFIYEKYRATARYGNVATITLINMLLNDGSKIKHLGGAYNSRISHKDMGRDNIKVARNILVKKQIRVVSEDVGGERGKKIVFNTNCGETAVLKVEKIRNGDWYPYETD